MAPVKLVAVLAVKEILALAFNSNSMSLLDLVGPENIEQVYIFKFLSWLEAETSRKTYIAAAILKI